MPCVRWSRRPVDLDLPGEHGGCTVAPFPTSRASCDPPTLILSRKGDGTGAAAGVAGARWLKQAVARFHGLSERASREAVRHGTERGPKLLCGTQLRAGLWGCTAVRRAAPPGSGATHRIGNVKLVGGNELTRTWSPSARSSHEGFVCRREVRYVAAGSFSAKWHKTNLDP